MVCEVADVYNTAAKAGTFTFTNNVFYYPGQNVTLDKSCATFSGNAYVEKDETGSILGGQCSVYYAADGKSVAMTVYSNSDYVNAVAVGEQTPFGASVVRYENGAFTVYAYPGDRGCVAEVFGFSEEELTNAYILGKAIGFQSASLN